MRNWRHWRAAPPPPTATGNISVAATAATDVITVSGTATAANFGIQTLTGRPPNGTVIGDDVAAFINDFVSGGAITVYDTAGSAVQVNLRWAKTDSASLGTGHSDTWNLFYQTNSNATGTAAAWQNVGTNFTFGANGEPNPPVTSLTLTNAHRQRHPARRHPGQHGRRRHHPVRRSERRRLGQSAAAERLRGRPAEVGIGRRQGPRGRHLFERPHHCARAGHARQLQQSRTS